jgi:ABC-type sulfate transport system substrate-binding protein
MKILSFKNKSILAGILLSISLITNAAEVTLLNVSYNPTRELYVEFNKAFATYRKAKTGDNVTIIQSHGGDGKQAHAVRSLRNMHS